jgi:hypothetical protein
MTWSIHLSEQWPMKRTRAILLWCFVALVVIGWSSEIVHRLQPSAEDVARSYLAENGWQSEKLSWFGMHRTTGFLNFTESETIKFYVKDCQPPREIEVELSRPFYFLGWTVVNSEERLSKWHLEAANQEKQGGK